MSDEVAEILARVNALKEKGNQQMKTFGNPLEAIRTYTAALDALEPVVHCREAKDLRRALILNRCRGHRKMDNHSGAYVDASAAVSEGESTGTGLCLMGRSLDKLIEMARRQGLDEVVLVRGSPPLRIEEVQLRALRAFYMATQKSSRKEEFMDDYRSARKAYFAESMGAHRVGIHAHIRTIQDAIVEMGLLLDGVSKASSLATRRTAAAPASTTTSTSSSSSTSSGGGSKSDGALDLDDLDFSEMDLADGGGVLVRDQQSEGRRRVEAAARRENALTSLAVLQTYLEDEEVIRHLSLSSRGNSVARFDRERCPDAPKPFGVEVPLCFQCPLSMAMYREPVILQSSEDPKLVSQHSYERSMIADVFRRVAQGEEFVDPSTRVSYGKRHPHLLPNHALKQAVSAYLQCYPHLFEK